MAPTKAECLKNKRSSYIDQLSRVQEFLNNEDEIAHAGFEGLQLRLRALEKLNTNFDSIQSELESASYDLEMASVRRDFEKLYFKVHPELTRRCDAMSPKINGFNGGNVPDNDAAQNRSIRLPDLGLPTFSGDTVKWMSFMEQFSATVDRKQGLSDGERFQYLLMALRGPALKIVESIEISNENYAVAMGLLKERYDNKNLIVQEHIRQLFNIKSVDRNSSKDLRELVDSTRAHVRALQSLGRPVGHWDDVIIYLIETKLDFYTLARWQEESPVNRFPLLTDLFATLNRRCQVLENTARTSTGSSNIRPQSTAQGGTPQKSAQTQNNRKASSSVASTTNATPKQDKCILCGPCNHNIYRCDRFSKLTPADRLNEVKRLKVCVNCLKFGHSSGTCSNSPSGCKICGTKHHTLLHIPSDADANTSNNCFSNESDENSSFTSMSCTLTEEPNIVKLKSFGEFNYQNNYVFLATAMVIADNGSGNMYSCRVLLDSGSQLNFITESLAHHLQLARQKSEICVTGVGGRETAVRHRTFLTIRSRFNDYALPIEVHVLPKITEHQPDRFVDVKNFIIPPKMPLADPKFNIPQKIDILIGAEHYFNLLSIGQIGSANTLPILQNTLFGWVVSGKNASQCTKKAVCHVLNRALVPLDKQVQQFWELEQPNKKLKMLSQEEIESEQHFCDNVYRNSDGRYVVRLPFSTNPEALGDSEYIATKRFYNLERKFEQKLDLKLEYTNFMVEYLRLGHMEEILPHKLPKSNYFLPHHSVIKPDSSTTHLRVVFDASAKTTKGNSLNDLLMVGPTVQSDIFSILLRFRLWQFAFSTDISKMYRQILVDPADRNYQCILWRNNPKQKLKTYRLNTITYGTSAAPFLATRTLNQLASDHAEEFPAASQAILNDCYVDDVVTGCDSLADAVRLQSQLIGLMDRGCFELRKWCANNNTLLNHLPSDHLETRVRFRDNDVVKALGLIWEPTNDQFLISISPYSSKRITKRTVLAETMRIFDPLGLISPVVVKAKIFLQHLWKINLSWDAALPQDLHTIWIGFRNQLPLLYSLSFERHVIIKNAANIEIHAFADASEKAYGAVVFIQSIDRSGAIKVVLYCSKSRVAPTKSVSLPRIELCAAEMAAELVHRIVDTCDRKFNKITYWTDSKIVLSWIAAPAYNWKTFVSNRVANIQELSDPLQWFHVGTRDNPADLTSRGCSPQHLIDSDLWFNGPEFLQSDSDHTDGQLIYLANVPERKQLKVSLVATQQQQPDLISDRFDKNNSYLKTIRLIAVLHRFISNVRSTIAKTGRNSINRHERNEFGSDELQHALFSCVKSIQSNCFAKDIDRLRSGRNVSERSSIVALNPFIDNNNVLRVGGRLENAEIPFESKHQIILPSNHQFTTAMMVHFHEKNLHAGPQALLASVRGQFWPIHGKQLAKRVVRKCYRCFRVRPPIIDQLMGQVPKARLIPCRPFTNTGMDFMGPIQIHYKIRGKKPTKAYVALFVCFWSRAVHLEVVSDLSTDAFMASLKRFVGRRGLPTNIYSDNATNFIGAKNELIELRQQFLSDQTQNAIKATFAQDGVKWHTIPPRSPHFGGLWEAGVKTAKHHFKRQCGLASLTFEQLTTVAVQVEAVMNSRPLAPLSSNSDDLDVLTPGHFLIGAPLTAVNEKQVDDQINRLEGWKRINWVHQQFWARWSKEYIHQLQCRTKWRQVRNNIKIDQLVLLQEDNVPPLRWPLGRVVAIHPGKDGLVRAVTVKTKNGEVRRAITRIAGFPTEDDH